MYYNPFILSFKSIFQIQKRNQNIDLITKGSYNAKYNTIISNQSQDLSQGYISELCLLFYHLFSLYFIQALSLIPQKLLTHLLR